MDPLREQLETIREGLEAGQIGLRDYLAAMRGQMAAMEGTIGNVPLMVRLAGAPPEDLARIEDLAAEMMDILRRAFDEGGPTP